MNKQVEGFLMGTSFGPVNPEATIDKSKDDNCSEKRTLPISCKISFGRLRMSIMNLNLKLNLKVL